MKNGNENENENWLKALKLVRELINSSANVKLQALCDQISR